MQERRLKEVKDGNILFFERIFIAILHGLDAVCLITMDPVL